MGQNRSDERREASDGGTRPRCQAAWGPVEGAMLAWRVGALLARGGSPTALGPKKASLPLPLPLDRHLPLPTLLPLDWGWGLRLRLALGGVELGGHGWQRWQWGRLGTGLGLSGVGLSGVAVGLGAGDALLLAPP